jgi:hypothetical protein
MRRLFERAVHRAAVGDLQEALFLIGIQRPLDLDFAFDSVQHAFLGFTGLAVGGVNLVMRQADGGGLYVYSALAA